MPLYKFTNRETGETAQLQSDTLPSEQQIDALFAQKQPSAGAQYFGPPSPAPQPPQNASPSAYGGAPESMAQYIGRSPVVQDVGAGAQLVGAGAGVVAREAGQNLSAGWDTPNAAPPVQRGDVGGVAASFENYANRNVVQPATAWWNREVTPPPLVPVQGPPSPPQPRRYPPEFYDRVNKLIGSGVEPRAAKAQALQEFQANATERR